MHYILTGLEAEVKAALPSPETDCRAGQIKEQGAALAPCFYSVPTAAGRLAGYWLTRLSQSNSRRVTESSRRCRRFSRFW